MIRIKNKTIANTSKIWIKLFTILNPTKPSNHKINKIIAIVVIIWYVISCGTRVVDKLVMPLIQYARY
jgi:hypothetical protein